MSRAGIQSNRGDGYQTLVAFHWALKIISSPEYEWLEIDSVTRVTDDVVVGKPDGRIICCQCKKNQKNHKPWTIADLADELEKACKTLTDPQAVVHFYSRSPFSELLSLKEHFSNYPNQDTSEQKLSNPNKKANKALQTIISRINPDQSTFDFLSRSRFVLTVDIEEFRNSLRERLGALVSNPDTAFNAIWTRLGHLSMRITVDEPTAVVEHRLNREDLITTISRAGAMLTPPVDARKVLECFRGTSSIGRNWRRTVGELEITSPVVGEILAAIAEKPRSVLLTGSPGSGKTCVLLTVQDHLERSAADCKLVVPIFIQAREFADLKSAEERHAQGLSINWVEEISRIAETAHVIVVVDSLDVLSISREHDALKYFLGQIDRLLCLSNVTVLTACRDFDRQYDLRIAQRKWDREFRCAPLDWKNEVAPLLESLDIDSDALDDTTQAIICSPRELSLFVDLAKSKGSFRVGDSHDLTTQYLDYVMEQDSNLGAAAMQDIEAMAINMLRDRKLAVDQQRFSATQDVRRALLSNGILHQTVDSKLTFGHQTLLDVLVVSEAARRGLTLSQFIKGLPPVPFVRPAIRAFIAHISLDRLKLRSQIRTVLNSNYPFHFRRLVAETFAERSPKSEDWPMIRDLWRQHRDIYTVLYKSAQKVEWQIFWLENLVPHLIEMREADELLTHASAASLLKKEIPSQVSALWLRIIEADWIDRSRLAQRLEWALRDISTDNADYFSPLIVKLLALPRPEHSLIGRTIAQCVTAGSLDDSTLWDFVAGNVTNETIDRYTWDSDLRCRDYEFSDKIKTFFADRLQDSNAFLELAIAAIEKWSQIKNNGYPAERRLRSFLNETTFSDASGENQDEITSTIRILLDGLERSLIGHAKENSQWWQLNRHRICFSTEKSLQYFGIISCIATPLSNLDLASEILCFRPILESDLSDYAGELIRNCFIHLTQDAQDSIQSLILSLYSDIPSSEYSDHVRNEKAQLFISIPAHLRAKSAQIIIDQHEACHGPLVPRRRTFSGVGWVHPPFNCEVFLSLSDESCLSLFVHYHRFNDRSYEGFLTGGESYVAAELRSAAARTPTRFLELLRSSWSQIPPQFREAIIEGSAEHIQIQKRNRESQKSKVDTFETFDQGHLASLILDEFERHPYFWTRHRSAAHALRMCMEAVSKDDDIERTVFQALGYAFMHEEQTIFGSNIELLDVGMNSGKGQIAEALTSLAGRLAEEQKPWPELLIPTLSLFAAHPESTVRAPLIVRLPQLQHFSPDVGWDLFDKAMKDAAPGLWAVAEACLYHTYHHSFNVVEPWLSELYHNGTGKDLTVFGRIGALAALSAKLDFDQFLTRLRKLNSVDAWSGASAVWSNAQNLRAHTSQCVKGLELGLREIKAISKAVASRAIRIFRSTSTTRHISPEFFQLLLSVFENQKDQYSDIYGIEKWLNECASWDPGLALSHAEAYIGFVRSSFSFIYDHENNLTQLLRSLFAQAEELEESDGGEMLRRVVMLQDHLLALDIAGVHEWLRAAERGS